MVERTTVRLPEDLLSRAKRKAADEGRTLTSLIEEALRRVVANDRRTPPAKRILPRVSQAGGGLMPGVELGSAANLQEADDLDYIRRMQRGG
ncbi:MAG: ribbon-helix-helix protein, CopG family [Acetobacteraceae bacterium]|jgi:hypothetical protein